MCCPVRRRRRPRSGEGGRGKSATPRGPGRPRLRGLRHGTRWLPGERGRTAPRIVERQPLMTKTSRITTPFDGRSTAAEVVSGVDLTGRRAVVTGAASGIGVETARALAGAGAQVTLAVRDTAAGERAAQDIRASAGGARVHVARLDLADLRSVAEFSS